MTAHGTTETAIEATKFGAYDYLLKPFEMAELLDLVGRASVSSRLMKEPVEFGNINETLRRSETGDRVDALAFAQVEHFGGVVAQRADEQSFAGGVEIEVINPSFHARQRDRLLQLKSRVTRFSGDEMTSENRDDNSER